MNFASFKNALGQVVQSASSSARDFGATVRIAGSQGELHDTIGRLVDLRRWHILQVTGTPKALREYTLQGQSATGGLNGCWKIYTAKAKKEGGMSLALPLNVTRKLGASALHDSIVDSALPR